MPYPITLAHRLTRRLAEVRKDGTLPWLRADGKSQVTVEYQDGKPVAINTVVVSTQHARGYHAGADPGSRHQACGHPHPARGSGCLEDQISHQSHWTLCDRRPDGRLRFDRTQNHRRYLRRRVGRHGGGAFSGKDPSKVDRSAAYAARHLAKNIVAADLADRAEVALSYAIGVAQPTSVAVNTFRTNKVDEEKLSKVVLEKVDLTPSGIIKRLNLRQPIYKATAAYGHFGRDEFPWENLDLVDTLKSAF